MLIDPFQRQISYLRLSVTDRCDFRCTYCMEEKFNFLPKKELLSLEELARIARAFIRLGVSKIRITGGEPLIRRDIMALFRALSTQFNEGLKELTLTTNGSQLSRFAHELAELGVKRVNISLDTLDEEKFAAITRTGRLGDVLAGIDAAQRAGLDVKINCVALKGFNDGEFIELIEYFGARGIDITFIELMPMGSEFSDQARLGSYYPLTALRAEIESRFELHDLAISTGGPARYVERHIGEKRQRIGFISPLTNNFCAGCNRVRVSARGELFGCLGREGSHDLKSIIRASIEGDDAALLEAIRGAISHKPKGHEFDYSDGSAGGKITRGMSVTGG